MKKVNQKEKSQVKQKKIGKQLKEIIPSSCEHIREPIEVTHNQECDKHFIPEHPPIPMYEEWPIEREQVEEFLKPLNEESILDLHEENENDNDENQGKEENILINKEEDMKHYQKIEKYFDPCQEKAPARPRCS